MLYPQYYVRSKLIIDTLMRLLGDQDQKVRKAAAQAIAQWVLLILVLLTIVVLSVYLGGSLICRNITYEQRFYVIFHLNSQL